MAEADWRLPFARCVGMHASEVLVLLNAHSDKVPFTLPTLDERPAEPSEAPLADGAAAETGDATETKAAVTAG